MTLPNAHLIDIANLYRAESSLAEAAAQLDQFERRNGGPGVFADEVARLRDMTNGVVAVRDALPRTAAPCTCVEPAWFKAIENVKLLSR